MLHGPRYGGLRSRANSRRRRRLGNALNQRNEFRFCRSIDHEGQAAAEFLQGKTSDLAKAFLGNTALLAKGFKP